MVSAPTPPVVSATPYRLANLASLAFGYRLIPSWTFLSGTLPLDASPSLPVPKLNGISSSPGSSFSDAIQLRPGVYSIRQLVASASPLLNVIITRLGQDHPSEPPARAVLVDGLAASLATSGRESTLPLSRSLQDTAARRDIVFQANHIAKTIITHVQENIRPSIGSQNIHLRSACEGHLWTHAVAALLFGPRSDSQLMELYNEWLHRMILLRDSLLPFENYEEVPLVIPEGSNRGIRDAEEPRKSFLFRCLTGAIQHTAIVDLAKVFTARHLPPGGYGFQYSQGSILPAFLSGSRSLHLLRYHPARFQNSEPEALFNYEHKKYINAPRSELPPSSGGAGNEVASTNGQENLGSLLAVDTCVTESSLIIDSGNDAQHRTVKLRLTLDSGTCFAVDLGQITRGRRYAYEVRSEKKFNGSGSPLAKSPEVQPLSTSVAMESPATTGLATIVTHSTADILSRPGLVISPRTKAGQGNTIHIIPTTDPIIKLALLGKLYPENVILLKNRDDLDALGKVGKEFSERLMILEQNVATA
ncbi:Uncharacterized protein TCAP_05472 [Tolypocladium capitatum]|uniref:Uncharacterized protein n=1 Tax=Tolypocladium capitatum TaxID=45235 RepID=A0A2K3QAM6_9HYPO|nr:Uncharacterized protein TCAP_05472 [Tolypocladium capitatum]